METAGKKILLIEDEMFINDLYRRTLIKEGFQVLSAIDGQEGVNKASEKPDLVLLDIMLPKLNGLEVLKALKSNDQTKTIPVVLLTNLGQGDVIANAYKLGAQGYLMKLKVLPNDVVDTVKRFLENPKFVMEYSSLDLE